MEQLKYKVNWKPLEELARKRPDSINCEEFMYMGTLERVDMETGEIWEIHQYKNITTRKYLNLDEGGEFYTYRPELKTYRGTSEALALEWITQ